MEKKAKYKQEEFLSAFAAVKEALVFIYSWDFWCWSTVTTTDMLFWETVHVKKIQNKHTIYMHSVAILPC